MNSTQALVPVSASSAKNGNGHGVASLAGQPSSSVKSTAATKPLTDELVAEILKGRGVRGWLRLARVIRVLGLFTLYLFLDTYDVRADFNRRMASRLSEETPKNLAARLIKLYRSLVSFSLDKLIRLVRLIVFRGEEGSDKKEARLAKQSVWLR